MKTLALGVVLAAFGLAQQEFVFTDPSKNVEVRGKSGTFSLEAGPTYRFDLRSGVRAIVRDQGLEFTAQRVQGVTAKSGAKGALKRATATGGVKVVKSSAGTRTELTGDTAIYALKGAVSSLDLSGPVRITQITAAKSESLLATGTSASAILAAGRSASEPMRSATLKGPVAIDATSRVAGGGVEKIHAKGSRLDVDNTTVPAKLVLSGAVEIHGKQYGDARGLSKVTMLLNSRREVVSIQAEAGGRR